MRGGAGRDTLIGGLDDDLFIGGAAGDEMQVGFGFDTVQGESLADTVLFLGPDPVTFD